MSGEVKDYQVEIVEVHRNEEDVNKGIVLEVTDPGAAGADRGIVQGMSGSPIIQNGKIVGAVTHVFVQDSAKGFGIFIENMLEHVDIWGELSKAVLCCPKKESDRELQEKRTFRYNKRVAPVC